MKNHKLSNTYNYVFVNCLVISVNNNDLVSDLPYYFIKEWKEYNFVNDTT